MVSDAKLYHGTALRIDSVGLFLSGKSGSGKSDFALRCLTYFSHQGACLIGDDQVKIVKKGETLLMEPASTLQGLLEVRGLGIVRMPCVFPVPLSLIVEMTLFEKMERFPEQLFSKKEILGIFVMSARLDPFFPSACDKLKLLLAIQKGTCSLMDSAGGAVL